MEKKKVLFQGWRLKFWIFGFRNLVIFWVHFQDLSLNYIVLQFEKWILVILMIRRNADISEIISIQ